MLTYCTNIHPGESWAQVQRGIAENVPQIRDALSAPGNFPIGVWLSGRAQRDIAADGSREFQEWMTANRCEVQSINGFPYGDFHAGRVKENVYLPDWRDTERSDYSAGLARILASWLPEGKTGVISTVPLAFQKLRRENDLNAIRKNLGATLEVIDAIAQATGKQILLALEAEPACMLETTPEVLRFFAQLKLPASLAQHLGICFDCCHHAVEFESPARSLREIQDAGIRVAQAHVTCALRVPGGELERLARFSEPVYLHQTVGRRTDGSLVRFDDLPQALAAKIDGWDFDEWRVHFHVPVFQSQLGDCTTTQPELQEMLGVLPRETPLVVETYTFGVLPPELQARTMPESIARELKWVQAQLALQIQAPRS